MPKQVRLNGQVYNVPDDTSLEEIQALISGQDLQSVRSAQAEKFPTAAEQGAPTGTATIPTTTLDKAKSYLPSWRTGLRTGGAMLGGAIGGVGGTVLGTPIAGVGGAALGGAMGASVGESTYQLVKQLRGETTATPSEVALSQAGALTQGAAQEALPEAITKYAPPILTKSAGKKVGEAVQAGQQNLKIKRAIGKTAEDMIQEFPIRPTQSTLLSKLEQHATKAGENVDTAYESAQATGKTLESNPIIQYLHTKMARYFNQDAPIVGTESKIAAYQDVIDWLKENPNFSPKDFRNVKQVWDEIVQPSRNAGPFGSPDPAKTEALKEAADEVRRYVHVVFPEIAKADRASHVWLTLRNTLGQAIDKSIGVESLSRIVPRSAIGGTTGALINTMRGESPYQGALEGAVIGNLSQTTLWNTLSVAERVALLRIIQRPEGRVLLHGIATMGSGLIEEATQK